jgi:acyl-CoA synthetase (AMP-forming)/AMP-acid ligase II
MYGQTEATARISILDTSESSNKLKSVGKPILDGKIFIYDDFKRIKENTLLEGEIVYEGKNVSPGYATNYQDLLVEKKSINRLFTGDVGYIDSEGFLYITGRKKRFAKILGLSINLDEVEEMLKNLSYDAICISDDEKIYVAVNDLHNTEVVSSLLSEFLKLSSAKIQVFSFEDIPHTKSGKKDYQFFYQFLRNNGKVSNYDN